MAKAEDAPCPPPLEDLPALTQRDLPLGSVPAPRTGLADQAPRGRPVRRVSGTRLLALGPCSPLKRLGAGSGGGGGGGGSSSSSRRRRRSASCARRAKSARGSGRFSLSPCAGRRKMPQPKPGRAAAEADEGSGGGGGGGDKREPARPRMNGENIFTCQAKIYSYVNPSKISTSRPPLQEENSTTHPETKGQTCKLETCQKLEDRVPVGDSTSSVAKSDSQNSKATECESSASPASPNPEPTETQKLPPAKSDVVTSQKQVPHKGGKKPASRRKGQGKTPPNRKVTDYYPVRRSSRKNKKELQTEEKKRIDELIKSGKEDGMKIDFIDGKGRGVIATRHFNRGEFVVEYHGDLIEITDAKKREAAYAQDPSTGCYMYYFQYLTKTFCVDATKETNRLGRLVNHSKCGNCQTKLHDIGGVPHLILVASRDIKAGEELLYDYGDRSKASLEAHPWLKH